MDITRIAPMLGVVATVLFVISQAPMLVKAARTRDLDSYSGSNLVIANIGNVAQSGYIITLPMGPVWALHGFNTIASGCMLYWWLRYSRRGRAVGAGAAAAGEGAVVVSLADHHRSRVSTGVLARETHGKITELAG